MELIPRPSGLDLTVRCPGSLQLQHGVPPLPATFEQAEGTGAHTVALKHSNGAGAEWGLGRKFMVERHQLEVDNDMLDGALLYKGEAQPGGRFEEPVSIPDVHPKCNGTPDYWRCIIEGDTGKTETGLIWGPSPIRLLKVIDYKYGHRYVEVVDCYQLVGYAGGVIRLLNLPADFPVMLVIVQPRSYSGEGPIREWNTTAGEIIRICQEVIAPKVALAMGPNPPTVTGRHCTDCTARHLCKTYQQTTESLVDFSGTAEVRDLNEQTIGQELRLLKEAIKRLEGRYTGLYEHASSLAKTGGRIHHWGLEDSKGKLGWLQNTTVEEVGSMGDLLGINVRKPPALVTPTQAIAAGLDESVVMQYADRPRGARRLVPDDATKLSKIFKGNAA